MIRLIRVAMAAAMIGAVLGGVALVPEGALAQPSGGQPPTAPEATPGGSQYVDPVAAARMRAQEPLVAAAGRIMKIVELQPGYAGVGLEEDTTGVVVWWKGAMPGATKTAVDAARGQVRVRIVPAANSRRELATIVDRITRDIASDPASPYDGVAMAADGSGITVDTRPGVGGPRTLPAKWQVPARVDVKMADRGLHTTSRASDIKPFWGGARAVNLELTNPYAHWCSTGFAVKSGSSQYILTAGHCGRGSGGTWANGDGSETMGYGARENQPHDIMLISSTVAGRIYDGPVGTGEFSKAVIDYTPVMPNQWLCTSGATSGVICDFKVGTSFNVTYSDVDAYGNREQYTGLVEAYRQSGAAAAQGGDSGGPVFTTSGCCSVLAAGTISGSGGNRLVFQDFQTAMADFGISVVYG